MPFRLDGVNSVKTVGKHWFIAICCWWEVFWAAVRSWYLSLSAGRRNGHAGDAEQHDDADESAYPLIELHRDHDSESFFLGLSAMGTPKQ